MAVEQPKTQADILESLETILNNSDHPLLDDGMVEGKHAELWLRLRDGSVWALSPRCMRPGAPKERDYLDI
jgi:hypothetical protein